MASFSEGAALAQFDRGDITEKITSHANPVSFNRN